MAAQQHCRVIHVRLVRHLGKAELKHILERSDINAKVKRSNLLRHSKSTHDLLAKEEFTLEK